MKIFAIFLLLYLASMVFDVTMDLMIGKPLNHALHNLINPFWVKGGTEMGITFVLILMWIVPSVFLHFQAKRKTRNK